MVGRRSLSLFLGGRISKLVLSHLYYPKNNKRAILRNLNHTVKRILKRLSAFFNFFRETQNTHNHEPITKSKSNSFSSFHLLLRRRHRRSRSYHQDTDSIYIFIHNKGDWLRLTWRCIDVWYGSPLYKNECPESGYEPRLRLLPTSIADNIGRQAVSLQRPVFLLLLLTNNSNNTYNTYTISSIALMQKNSGLSPTCCQFILALSSRPDTFRPPPTTQMLLPQQAMLSQMPMRAV